MTTRGRPRGDGPFLGPVGAGCCLGIIILLSPLSPGEGSLFIVHGQESQRHLSQVLKLKAEGCGADVKSGQNPELQLERAAAASPRRHPPRARGPFVEARGHSTMNVILFSLVEEGSTVRWEQVTDIKNCGRET